MKVDKSKALLLLRYCKPGSIDSMAQPDIDKEIYNTYVYAAVAYSRKNMFSYCRLCAELANCNRHFIIYYTK